MTPETLEPDLREAQRFLTLLGEDLDNWTFQTFDDNTERRDRSLAQVLHQHNGPVASRLLDLNRRGAGVFAMINRGNGKGRTAQNVVEVRAVFVDLDGTPLIGIESAPLEPHIVIESSPGRYHAYWRIEGLGLDQFEAVQAALAQRFGSDPSVKDLPRVMRLPGFYHKKGAPFRTHIMRWEPLQPYTAEAFLKEFAIDPACDNKSPAVTGNGKKVRQGGRNAYLASLAGSMRRRGMVQTAIEAALQEENRQHCDPPLRPEEVASIAQSIGRYPPKEKQSADTVIRCLAEVTPTPIAWLWPGRIALGKVTLIVGDPGLGKSLLTIALAAHVSRGMPWPVDRSLCPSGDVLLLSAEDDIEDTIRPRLDAAGTDPHRVHALEAVLDVAMDGGRMRRLPNLARDVNRLDQILAGGEFRLVVIDPVSAYLSGVDTHRNADLRSVLAPLAELAAHRKVAIACVSHLNKVAGGSALYRTSGSIAFIAAARAAYVVARDPQDETRRLVLPVKNNLAEHPDGLAYRIRQAGNGAAILLWDDQPVTVSAEEALAPVEGDNKRNERSERKEAAEWLREMLDEGPMMAKDLQRHAREAGLAWRTVRRAKKDIGVIPKKTEFNGSWHWSLPLNAARRIEDGQANNVATFDQVGHLRTTGSNEHTPVSRDVAGDAAQPVPKTPFQVSGQGSNITTEGLHR
jgi:AAA domain/RepB DNA-primase N-terminal domain/Primase C terminal 1 (PriCT-1)